ncbi:class V chitinase-like [Impatiens glandulifera]|uniref:class V chitinase-like n=1 Tax=Impatiens glandulifera TaxID=253017 RepID=UPI001FB07F18|nr:class V chitinase-like [Impatiens glandulifera]
MDPILAPDEEKKERYPIINNPGENTEKLRASAEWSKQKEVELNQTMMESKPNKYKNTSSDKNLPNKYKHTLSDKNLSTYWFRASEFPLSSIDSTFFTHLFCAFANLDSNSNQLVIFPQDQDSFSKFKKTVQQRNPSVKSLISIGGGNADKSAYASMASQARKHSTQMTNFRILIDEWCVAVAAEARSSGREALLLTATVSFGLKVNGWLRYPYSSITKSLDWINVISYDFYDPKRANDGAQTREHAALYDPDNSISGRNGIRDWIQIAGVNLNKIVIGIPYYGYGSKLVNPNIHGLLDPTDGPFRSGESSIGYNQIRDFITQNRASSVFNATIIANYTYTGTTWIGYDSTQSFQAKVAYAKSKALRGYFAWHIGADYNWELSKTASQSFRNMENGDDEYMKEE